MIAQPLAAAGLQRVYQRCEEGQIERARAIAEEPARLRRSEARSEIIAARNIRIAERERARREGMAREAAERTAAEAAEAAAQAARKAEEEAREARRVEQARLDAAAAAERENHHILLAGLPAVARFLTVLFCFWSPAGVLPEPLHA